MADGNLTVCNSIVHKFINKIFKYDLQRVLQIPVLYWCKKILLISTVKLFIYYFKEK